MDYVYFVVDNRVKQTEVVDKYCIFVYEGDIHNNLRDRNPTRCQTMAEAIRTLCFMKNSTGTWVIRKVKFYEINK